MKRIHTLFAALAIASLGASACTEVEIAAWETATGKAFTDTQHEALLAAPPLTAAPTTTVEAPASTTTQPMVAVDEPPLPRTYTYPNPDIDQWHDLAMQAGFAEKDWKWLSCVINRETGSTGRPDLHNGKGRDDSYGLLQLNMKAHKRWVGPLVDYDFDRLYDPLTNLTIAYTLYEKAGRSPWRNNCSPTHT